MKNVMKSILMILLLTFAAIPTYAVSYSGTMLGTAEGEQAEVAKITGGAIAEDQKDEGDIIKILQDEKNKLENSAFLLEKGDIKTIKHEKGEIAIEYVDTKKVGIKDCELFKVYIREGKGKEKTSHREELCLTAEDLGLLLLSYGKSGDKIKIAFNKNHKSISIKHKEKKDKTKQDKQEKKKSDKEDDRYGEERETEDRHDQIEKDETDTARRIDETGIEKISEDVSGCRVNGEVVPAWTRIFEGDVPSVCNPITQRIVPQKRAGQFAQNSKECLTNQARDGRCIDPKKEKSGETKGLIQGFISWLSGFV